MLILPRLPLGLVCCGLRATQRQQFLERSLDTAADVVKIFIVLRSASQIGAVPTLAMFGKLPGFL